MPFKYLHRPFKKHIPIFGHSPRRSTFAAAIRNRPPVTSTSQQTELLKYIRSGDGSREIVDIYFRVTKRSYSYLMPSERAWSERMKRLSISSGSIRSYSLRWHISQFRLRIAAAHRIVSLHSGHWTKNVTAKQESGRSEPFCVASCTGKTIMPNSSDWFEWPNYYSHAENL